MVAEIAGFALFLAGAFVGWGARGSGERTDAYVEGYRQGVRYGSGVPAGTLHHPGSYEAKAGTLHHPGRYEAKAAHVFPEDTFGLK